MITPKHTFSGKHIYGELYDINSSILNDESFLTTCLTKGIMQSGATICSIQSKKFQPHGVTILALLSESHASIHTYPERNSLFFDAFTCGDRCKPQNIANILISELQAGRVHIQSVNRGEGNEN